MLQLLRTLGWLACVVYSTIPSFWLMVHPRAHRWRVRVLSPLRVLVPAWVLMWVGMGALTGPWRRAALYSTRWTWIPAALLFGLGIYLYLHAGTHFSLAQLGGLPEIRAGHQDDRLVTTGIRARVRHPVYLGHLCEMLAWSAGTGLVVCWVLTAFAMITGAVMIRMEDKELEEAVWRKLQPLSAVGAGNHSPAEVSILSAFPTSAGRNNSRQQRLLSDPAPRYAPVSGTR